MKKIFTLLIFLVAIVTGAKSEVKTTSLVAPSSTTKSHTDADGIITLTSEADISQGGVYITGYSDKAMKLKGSKVYNISYKSGVTIIKTSLLGVRNSDSSTGTVGKDEKDKTSLGTLPNRKSPSATIDITGQNTFCLSSESQIILEVKYTTEPLATDKPTIIDQPQDCSYVMNTSVYPTMTVNALTSGGSLLYQWQFSPDGTEANYINIPTEYVASADKPTLNGADAASLISMISPNPGDKLYFRCKVTDNNGSVISAPATIELLGEAPSAPTFSIAPETAIKVLQHFTVTSEEGTVIYSNWSSSQGKYTAESLMAPGRTPSATNVAEASTSSTSDSGYRYFSAIAYKEGYAPSEVAEIKVKINTIKIKGNLDKTEDVVDVNAEAPAIPVFTVVDGDGDEVSASSDIKKTYSLAEGSTSGIVTLKEDGSGIEAFNTAINGTATVEISLTSNIEAAPVMTGEGTYTYTITVGTPALHPTIDEQPASVTFKEGDTDYPTMTVKATASEGGGDVQYEWFVDMGEGTYITTSITTQQLDLKAYIENMIEIGYYGDYNFKCKVIDANGEIFSKVAKLSITYTAPADPTFDKAASSTIKAGEPVIATSDNGSQIYYNWSSKATGGYTKDQLLTRTPKDSPASITTSTTGSRYLYAVAKKGDLTSEMVIIGYTVIENPVKGSLSKTEDNVEKDAVVELPVFTLVDADGNPSPASKGPDDKKDIKVEYSVTGTEGIITLNADKTDIEAISTANEGTATVTITITYNKNGYPIITGEGTYTYTITVGAPSAVNGIAEDAEAAENANVKIIKNGKLYIGNYNIAGQLVK